MSFVLSYLVKRYRNSEGLTTCIPRDKEDSGLTQKLNMAIFTIHLTVTRFSKILCLLCKKWVQIIPFWIDLSTVIAAPMIYCSFSCKTKYDEAAVYLKAVLYTSHYHLWQHEIVSGRLSFRDCSFRCPNVYWNRVRFHIFIWSTAQLSFVCEVFFMFQCNPYTDIEHKIDFSCIVTTLWLTSLSVIRKLWANFILHSRKRLVWER